MVLRHLSLWLPLVRGPKKFRVEPLVLVALIVRISWSSLHIDFHLTSWLIVSFMLKLMHLKFVLRVSICFAS
jgi:hypothetical protein